MVYGWMPRVGHRHIVKTDAFAHGSTTAQRTASHNPAITAPEIASRASALRASIDE
jgi:hypothetical protein